MTSTDADTARWLLSPEAVRQQTRALFEAGLDGKLGHFTINLDKLDDATQLVCQVIRDNYPSLQVPPHARWRHFMVDGVDHWLGVTAATDGDVIERARTECELAIVSVLLDAGAGPQWSYSSNRITRPLARSEGLAIASLDAFAAGAFSSHDAKPLQADASGLLQFDARKLTDLFQVSPKNPLEGLEGRAALIQRLGAQMAKFPDIFGTGNPRLGAIADHLLASARNGQLPAREILITLLAALGPIWPGRIELGGQNLGDTWMHPLAPVPGLVPFHKLSQWLTYSLFEPLQRTGLTITEQDKLTGLAEYRNGGLFIDTGVIALRDELQARIPQEPSSELVIEWRALTVALLDDIAVRVRHQLGTTPDIMPLASVLEGGTWAAGRRIASTRRAGGGPPITIVSDGSVF